MITRYHFTPEDYAEVVEVAALRLEMMKSNGRHRPADSGDDKWTERAGAAGELALARILGRPWTGRFFGTAEELDAFHAIGGRDVDPFEVRTVPSPKYALTIRKKDTGPVALVVVPRGQGYADFLGWAQAESAKDEKWRDEAARRLGRPAAALSIWMVPPEMLVSPLYALDMMDANGLEYSQEDLCPGSN